MSSSTQKIVDRVTGMPFKVGDRVTMQSGLAPLDGKPRVLTGVVATWGTDRLIVCWDGWPTMTPLPNPNVRHL